MNSTDNPKVSFRYSIVLLGAAMIDDSFAECNLWGDSSTSVEPILSWNKDVLNNVEEEVVINSIRNISYKKYFCNHEELVLPLVK